MTGGHRPDFTYKMRAERVSLSWDTHGHKPPIARIDVSGPVTSGSGPDGPRRLETRFTFDNADGSADVHASFSIGEPEFVVPLHPSQQDLAVFMAQAIPAGAPPVTVVIWQKDGRLNGAMNFNAPGEMSVDELVGVTSADTYKIPPDTYDMTVGRWWCNAQHYLDGGVRRLRTAYRAPGRRLVASSRQAPTISELLVTFDYIGSYPAPQPCVSTSTDTIMLYWAPEAAFDGVFQNILCQRNPDRPALTARLIVANDHAMTASLHLDPMEHWPQPASAD